MSTLDSPFSTGESRVALLVQCNAGLGWVDGDAECSRSSYLSYVTHLSLCGPWGCFIHILGSGIFMMVSCLWIVASWSFGDGHWSWDWFLSPSWWHYFKWALWYSAFEVKTFVFQRGAEVWSKAKYQSPKTESRLYLINPCVAGWSVAPQ